MINIFDELNKSYERFEMAYNWLIIERMKINVCDYFKKSDINAVSIYGYSKLAKILIDELVENNIKIDYIVDQNADDKTIPYPTYKLSDDIPKTKLIIITIPGAADVREKIREKNIGNSIVLSDLLKLYSVC